MASEESHLPAGGYIPLACGMVAATSEHVPAIAREYDILNTICVAGEDMDLIAGGDGPQAGRLVVTGSSQVLTVGGEDGGLHRPAMAGEPAWRVAEDGHAGQGGIALRGILAR